MSDPFSYDCRLDAVLCLEATEAMRPYFSAVKEMAKMLPERLFEASEERAKDISALRVRVIAFRRIGTDRDPIRESRFFTLPEEAAAYGAFIDSITLAGQSLPSGLEALSRALSSDFVTEGRKQRHLVMMISPSAAAELGTGAKSPDYPRGMPKDLQELCERWEMGSEMHAPSYRPRAGRLMLYTASPEFWEPLECWSRCWAVCANGGEDLGSMLLDEGTLDMALGLLFGGF